MTASSYPLNDFAGLDDILPAASKSPRPATRSRFTPSTSSSLALTDSVIAQFNARFSREELLARYGYEFDAAAGRYTPPESESRMPGVVLLDDGKLYFHNASDPLHDGHAHDAFDLYCMREHGGEQTRAVRAAAELLGMTREPATRYGDNEQGMDETGVGATEMWQTRRLVDLLDDPELSKPAEYVVHSLFTVGSLNNIYGAPKAGKSTMAAHLAKAVALGEHFAGLRTRQGKVLWVDLEQGLRRLTRSLGSVPGVRDLLRTPDYFDIYSDLTNKGRSVSALAATVARHPYVLVIIDSIGKFAQIEDENDNAKWQQALQPMEELARASAAAFVFIDHDRKSEGEHGRGLRGASSKLAAMDSAVHFRRAKSGNPAERRLDVVSRENGTFELNLVLGQDGFTQIKEEVVCAVEGALVDNGPMSEKVTLEYLKGKGLSISRSTVKTRLAAGLESGRLERAGTGSKSDPFIYSAVSNAVGAVNNMFWQNDSNEDDE